jgi:hypothetical protein
MKELLADVRGDEMPDPHHALDHVFASAGGNR